MNFSFLKNVAIAFALIFSFQAKAQLSKKFTVYFDVNQSKIKPNDYLVLDSVVNLLKVQTNIRRIQLNGYADTTGNAVANLELSTNRTDTVAGYIMSKNLSMYKKKFNAASLGEKVTGADLDEMRRVDIVIYFAKPDRDTLIKSGCISALISANTFEGYNNDELVFKIENIATEADIKKYNILMKDDKGSTLLSNGIVRLTATYKGKPVKNTKPVLIKLPVMNQYSDYKLYESMVAKDKTITWKPTDNKVSLIGNSVNFNDEPCALQAFQTSKINEFINCATKNPACNCSNSSFGGLETPTKSNEFAKYGSSNGIVLMNAGSFKKIEISQVKSRFYDNISTNEMLSLCNNFLYPGISNIPSIQKYDREIIRFADIDVCQHNDSAELIMNKKETVLIFIPKSQLPAHKGKKYAILSAETKNDNFLNWPNKVSFPDSCLGLINCDFIVFDAPFSGLYSILELTPIDKKGFSNADDAGEETSKAKKISIKVKKINDATLVYGNKEEGVAVYSKFIKNKGKSTILATDFEKKSDTKNQIFLAHKLIGGKHYAWIGYGTQLKKNFITGKLKTPKLVYVPDEDWENFIKKYCNSNE